MDLCAGLHHLAAATERYVDEHDRLPAADIAGSSLSARLVPQDLREHVTRQFADLTEGFSQQVQRHLDQLDLESIAGQVTDPFQWITTEVAGLVDHRITDAAAAMRDVPTDNPALLSYLMQYSQAIERRPLLPMLRRALLITAVDSAETMLTGVVHRIQYDQGGAGRWGPPFDNPQLDRAVRRLTRGSIEHWPARLSDDLGVDLSAAACDWSVVTEIWARRNALVHAGGVADQKYIERMPGTVRGAPLTVDDQYLRNSINVLCGFVLGVIFLAWSAAQPKRRGLLAQLACIHSMAAESEQRWPLAESLHMLSARMEDEPQEAAADRVNGWLARAHWRGSESIKNEVAAWEVHELPLRFKLAKTILLGQLEDAIAMIPTLVDLQEITTGDLRDWPLFDSLRSEPEFQRLAGRLPSR